VMSIDVEFAEAEVGNCDLLSFAFTSMETSANSIRWSLEISAKSSLAIDQTFFNHEKKMK